MAKYHVNPENGKASLCRARKSCPFGDIQNDHYASEREARAAYEKSMDDFTIPEATQLEVGPKYRKPSTVIPEVTEGQSVDEVRLLFKDLLPGDKLPDGKVILSKELVPRSPSVIFTLEDGTQQKYARGDLAFTGAEVRTHYSGLYDRERAIEEFKTEEVILNALPRPNKFWAMVETSGLGRKLADYTEALDRLVEEQKQAGRKYPYRDAWASFQYDELRPPAYSDLGPFIILDPFVNRGDKPAVAGAKAAMKALVNKDMKWANNDDAKAYIEKLKQKNPFVAELFQDS